MIPPPWHVFPMQQPLGQEVPSQTQVPPRHCWPAPQAAPVPQAHVPFVEQESAVTGSQLLHVPPRGPHSVSDTGVQVEPVQHPLGHELPPHGHTPAEQV